MAVTFEPMFESMDIEQTEKVALQEAFDNAVVKKTTEMLDEHVESILAEKEEVLKEEYNEKVEGLTESLDGYLDQVVEDFIAENAPVYEAQIADEKASTLLEAFDSILTLAGVDMLRIQEAKEEEDDEEETDAKKLKASEEKVDEMAEKLVAARREADKYLRAGVIKEIAEGLTVLETAKFEKLAEMVAFDRNPSYVAKLETIKESIVDSRSDDFNESAPALPTDAFKQPEAVNTKVAMDFSKYV